MADNKGQIGEVVSQLDDGYVLVRVKRHSTCEKCNACDLGGLSKSEKEVTVKNDVNAEVGDHVVLDVAGRELIFASLILYILPLIGLFIGLLFGHHVFYGVALPQNIVNLSSGLLFMFIIFFLIRVYDNKIKATNKYRPKILKVITLDDDF